MQEQAKKKKKKSMSVARWINGRTPRLGNLIFIKDYKRKKV
jgi:hypothetical protein